MVSLAKPDNIKWAVIVGVVSEGALAASPTWLAAQLPGAQCLGHHSVGASTIWKLAPILSGPFRLSRDAMRHGAAHLVVRPNPLKVFKSMGQDIRFGAFFALAETAIAHCRMPIEVL